jgi:hypothetical protein
VLLLINLILYFELLDFCLTLQWTKIDPSASVRVLGERTVMWTCRLFLVKASGAIYHFDCGRSDLWTWRVRVWWSCLGLARHAGAPPTPAACLLGPPSVSLAEAVALLTAGAPDLMMGWKRGPRPRPRPRPSHHLLSLCCGLGPARPGHSSHHFTRWLEQVAHTGEVTRLVSAAARGCVLAGPRGRKMIYRL